MLGVDPRSFARWAYAHGVRPLHRVRIGRSTVTAWSMTDLARVTAPKPTEGSDWDQTYRDAGYEWCRPCGEWHRPPECAIDELGRALHWTGVPWDQLP